MQGFCPTGNATVSALWPLAFRFCSGSLNRFPGITEGPAVIMAKKEPFTLVFAPIVYDHLGAIDAKYDSLIRQKVEEQLTYEPDTQTRNRKPVRQAAAF
jgi:hypothetical protein